ncbi:MAG: hypothetical protein WC705_00780 [Candidatus Paceibacterota bacterium]|jgi:hypothetical protein
MFYFVVEIIFFICLGLMVYMLAKKLPVVDNSFFTNGSENKSKLTIFIGGSKWMGAVDKKFNSILARILRRSKLILMKMDNFVGKHIENIKDKNDGQNGIGQNIISEIHSENKEEKSEEE